MLLYSHSKPSLEAFDEANPRIKGFRRERIQTSFTCSILYPRSKIQCSEITVTIYVLSKYIVVLMYNINYIFKYYQKYMESLLYIPSKLL